MHWKALWMGWIFASLAIQYWAINTNKDKYFKLSSWTFNVGLMGFFLS
jgi:hypothetical protein